MWFAHQPFFVPDEEVEWRLNSSYIPLIDGFVERGIPFSFGMTGALLLRVSKLDPSFIELLQQHIKAGCISLLGTAAHHPFLPWLTTGSTAAQIEEDQSIRNKLGLNSLNVFWPPELAWSMRVGRSIMTAGYKAVVVDRSCCELSDTPPLWSAANSTLAPDAMRPRRANKHSRLTLEFKFARTTQCLDVWVRQRTLSESLVDAIKGDHEDTAIHVERFIDALERATDEMIIRDAPVLFGEDIERIFPDSIAEFFNVLDKLPEHNVTFCSAHEFQERALPSRTSYVPAGTMQFDEILWANTFDDRVYRDHLERVTSLFERIVGLNVPSAQALFWKNELLKIQDSGFYFWPFISRSRRPFYDTLFDIEEWLNGLQINGM
jgi:hypothetical protein